MALTLFDTLSAEATVIRKQKKPLKMFVCGPTVYGPAHIGHARVEIVFDVLARYIRESGYALSYIQNITDVDDKIIARAKEDGVSPQTIAKKFEVAYVRDMKALGVVGVDRRARASEFIKEIIAQAKRLEEKGFAYATPEGLYFDVRKFKGYGALSRQDLDALRHGYRIEPDPLKHDPLDFALWKKTDGTEGIGWKSPWGYGRPGWHIEDTAITEKLFGQQYDIHGGGLDLKFPHHEAEIAQQEAVSGKRPFVRVWMHVGLVMMGEAKMSKSLKNFVTVEEFLKSYGPAVYRFIILSAHYRSPLQYTEEVVSQAVSALRTVREFLARLDLVAVRGDTREVSARVLASLVLPHEKAFKTAMDADFNTPEALAALFVFMNGLEHDFWKMPRTSAIEARKFLVKHFALFGFMFKKASIPAPVAALVKKREVLRAAVDFKGADAARTEISIAGYAVTDTPLGPLIIPLKTS